MFSFDDVIMYPPSKSTLDKEKDHSEVHTDANTAMCIHW